MIVQWFFDVATGFVVWLTSLFPVWTAPDWFVALPGQVNQLAAGLSGLGAWVDWSLMFGVVASALTVFVACFVIKLVLRLVAFLPWVGGAG